jgi:hypothetical protein
MKKVITILMPVMLLMIGCTTPKLSDLKETVGIEHQRIVLPTPFDSKYAEYSSICKLRDGILLIPQYPERLKTDDTEGSFVLLNSEDLETYTTKDSTLELRCRRLPIKGLETLHQINNYEGFEAAIADGDQLYFTIEVGGEKPYSIAIKGIYLPEENQILLDEASQTVLDTPISLDNASYESITLYKDRLYFFYEGNGININPNPYALSTDLNFGDVKQVPFPSLEYRITDATSVSADGKFYVINYFWPGDAEKYKPAKDPITMVENQETGVERLVPLRILGGKIIPDTRFRVVTLEYADRNWEGIIGFNDGFLIVTDKFPQTELLLVKNRR